MSSLLYLVGEGFNHVGRGPNAITTAGTVDSKFPVANLGIYRPDQPFSFSQAVAAMRIIVDTQLLTQGTFESGSFDALWVDADTSTGVSSVSNLNPHAGTYGMRLAAVTTVGAVASRSQDITIRSGERLELAAWMDLDGTTSSPKGIYVRNLDTGKYLTSAGAWSSTAQISSLLTPTSSVYTEYVQQFQVESREDCGGLDTVTLRVQPIVTRDGSDVYLYVDDIRLVPAINFLGIFSHNLTPVTTPIWRSDPSGAFSGGHTNRAVFNAAGAGIPTRPNFYAYLSTAQYVRYWDLILSGTPRANPRIGEMVMGYAEALTLIRDPQWSVRYEKPQVRSRTAERSMHVTSQGPAGAFPVRTVEMPFAAFGDSEREEILLDVYGRSGWGEIPAVIVPDDDEADVVFGTLVNAMDLKRRHLVVSESSLVIEEEAHMDWIDG